MVCPHLLLTLSISTQIWFVSGWCFLFYNSKVSYKFDACKFFLSIFVLVQIFQSFQQFWHVKDWKRFTVPWPQRGRAESIKRWEKTQFILFYLLMFFFLVFHFEHVKYLATLCGMENELSGIDFTVKWIYFWIW